MRAVQRGKCCDLRNLDAASPSALVAGIAGDSVRAEPGPKSGGAPRLEILGRRALSVSQIQGLRRKGNPRPGSFDDPHDVEQHLLLRFEKGLPVERVEVREQLDVEREGSETNQPNPDRLGAIDHRVGREAGAQAGEDGVHLLGGGVVAQPDEMMQPELVARRQRLDVRVRNLTVGHAQDGPILGADARRSQPDVVDGADGLPEPDEIAHAHGLVDDDRHAADDVLERLLCGQSDRDAADAEAGERGGGIDPDVVQEHEHARA